MRHRELESAQEPAANGRIGPTRFLLLLLLTAGSIAVHGYHPFVEDAEIYVPGTKKLLNPTLYLANSGFFESHAKMTLFPNVIAWSVRLTHLPLEWALLGWHFLCVFLLLLACWKLGRICFGSTRSAWGGAVLVASLLTIPVAGTALYIMDQYLNTRSFSTAAAIWIILSVAERKYLHAAGWLLFTAVLHPLMAVFTLVFALLLIAQRSAAVRAFRSSAAYALFPLTLFPPVTHAYRQALDLHSYFFLQRWEWYEWLGVFGPLVILWWFRRIAQRRRLDLLPRLCAASIIFGGLFIVLGLIITSLPQFTRFLEIQPMRSFQLIYILLFVVAGGLMSEYVLKNGWWRWLVLFTPLCAGMSYAQRQLFPSTVHIEWPGRKTGNEWVQAFIWIRENTPVNAYFALDPDHMRQPGEDQHGFRAVAERSMLADRVKDSGAVTMFPALANDWLEQVSDQESWKRFGLPDFERLRQKYGVNWVVLQRPGVVGLSCPYTNAMILVCRIGNEHSEARAQ